MDILLAAIPIAPVARTADLLAVRVLAQDVGEAVIRLRAARQARGAQPLGLALAAARAVLLVEAQAGFCQQGIELFIRQLHLTSKHIVMSLIVARRGADQASAPAGSAHPAPRGKTGQQLGRRPAQRTKSRTRTFQFANYGQGIMLKKSK